MDCLFCKIVNKEIPSKIVYEDDKVLSFMDINPVCDGHILIVPKKHFDTVFDLDKDTLEYMFKIAKIITDKVLKALKEKGSSFTFNYLDKQNVKHVHLHIIPNFNKKPTRSVDENYKLIMESIND